MIVAVVVVGGRWSPPRPPAVDAQPGEDPALLRELFERLLTSVVGPSGEPLVQARILPGALPEGLPLRLPVPAGARIVGSVALNGDFRAYAGGPRAAARDDTLLTMTILDIAGPRPEVAGYIDQAITEQGWFKAPQPPDDHGGGFQSAPAPSFGPTVYCQSNGDYLVEVTVNGRPNRPADVRFDLMPDDSEYSRCRLVDRRPPFMPEREDLIPPLQPPPGVRLSGSSSGRGPEVSSHEATAETPISAAVIEAFYARQLEAAGWARRDGHSAGALAWSTWDLPGNANQQGFL